MAITIDDFSKIWASTSPLTPYSFSESNYKEGWNFIGGTPPSRQMWDFIQKQNDEKFKYLLNNFDDYAKKTDLDDYLPLSGGTMTGAITTSAVNFIKRNNNTSVIRFFGGTNDTDGAWLKLSGKSDVGEPGWFTLMAHNGTDGIKLRGLPNGALMWGTNNVLHAGNYNSYALPLSGGTLTGDVNGVTPPAGDDSKKLANTEFIQALANILVPTGCVQAFAGNTTPQGWLLCDGSAVSRTQYSRLFGVIGTTYGAGDGTDTFNVPNLVDKFIQGNAVAGTEKQAGLPNITGRVGAGRTFEMHGYGAFESTVNGSVYTTGGGVMTTATYAELDASRSSSIYGNSTTVQPPALTMRYIIKY